MSERTDTERLDWLEDQMSAGAAVVGLVHNDFKHWAVLTDGTQNIPERDEDGNYGEQPFPLATSFFAGEEELHRFKPTVREAIDYAMSYYDEGGE